MLALKQCKKILNKNEISDEYFLELHFCIEGCIKRLLFIGLRLNGVEYKTARESIDKYYKPFYKMLEQAFSLTGFDYQKDLCEYKNYKEIEEFFLGFSTKYRNYRVHGVMDKISSKNNELLKTLIRLDKLFIKTINDFIAEKKGITIFDEPKKWGAKKGTINSLEEVFGSILNAGVTKRKYSKDEVDKFLNSLG